MIGCERLCGRCGECEALTWALLATINPPEDVATREALWLEYGETLEALSTPSSLADLLARALRGRGVSSVEHAHGDGEVVIDIPSIPHAWFMFTSTARKKLSRLLALPLDCGPEVAIAAMEEG